MDVQDYISKTVVSSDGSKIGSVGQVFVDEGTDSPEWVTVKTGLFGSRESFVPLAHASADGDELRVPYTKDQVKDAPHFETDQTLSQSDEAELYRHYGLQRGVGTGVDLDDFASSAGRSDDDAMTRSEERLNVGTETVQTGTARLRKYIVTENVTQTVPVSHEEVRLEREPITDANRDAAYSGEELTEKEHEVVLTQERPVVTKETVPVERVRLSTETVNGQEKVDETVRKEQVDTVYPEGIDVADRESASR